MSGIWMNIFLLNKYIQVMERNRENSQICLWEFLTLCSSSALELVRTVIGPSDLSEVRTEKSRAAVSVKFLLSVCLTDIEVVYWFIIIFAWVSYRKNYFWVRVRVKLWKCYASALATSSGRTHSVFGSNIHLDLKEELIRLCCPRSKVMVASQSMFKLFLSMIS